MQPSRVLHIAITILIGVTVHVEAKQEKKNPPKTTSVVAGILEAEGGEHAAQNIKIYKVGYIETGETYFHVFRGRVKDEQYRIVIFDNAQNYLGYYATEDKPIRIVGNYIQLDSDPKTRGILLGNYGPFRQIRIGRASAPTILSFIPSSKYSDGYERFEYRKWKADADYRSYLSCGGLSRFVYYDKDNHQVLREWTDGSLDFAPVKYFSREDRKYLDSVIK